MKTRFLLTLMLCTPVLISYGQDDPFAGRSTTASADVASPKENIPEKKESFTAKLERYKASGFNVAVALQVSATKTNSMSSTTSITKNIGLIGEIPLTDSDFTPNAAAYAAKLNEAFGTDLFEVVDMKKIPYSDNKGRKMDDWSNTKYKMVVLYTVAPGYQLEETGGKRNAKYLVNVYAPIVEYEDTKKGPKLGYPLRMGNLGFYTKTFDEDAALKGLKNIEELDKLVNPAKGSELVELLAAEQDKEIGGYIEKLKK